MCAPDMCAQNDHAHKICTQRKVNKVTLYTTIQCVSHRKKPIAQNNAEAMKSTKKNIDNTLTEKYLPCA